MRLVGTGPGTSFVRYELAGTDPADTLADFAARLLGGDCAWVEFTGYGRSDVPCGAAGR